MFTTKPHVPHILALTTLFLTMSCLTQVQADLIGHWTFDDQTPEDLSGSGNDGEFEGLPLPTYTPDVPPGFDSGFSLSLAGGEGHVYVPHADSLNITSDMTIAAWVKTNGPDNGWDAILAKNPSDGSSSNHAGNYELRVDNGTRNLHFLHQRGGVDDTAFYPSDLTPFTDGIWQHVAVTAAAGGSVDFYLNGELTDSQAIQDPFGATNTSPLYIGSRADLFTTMDGLLDDVRLYDEVLSAEEIRALIPQFEEPYEKLPVLGARASSEYTDDSRLAIYAVNGAGLNGKSHVTAPQNNMWLTASNDPAPELLIDLGSVHAVNELRFWNYNENANPTCCLDRGVQTFDVYLAGRDRVFGAKPVLTGATLSRAPGIIEDFSEVINLSGAEGRYIKIAVTSNYGDPTFTGLSEVNVTGTFVQNGSPIQGVVATASTNLVGFDRNAEYLTDGSGLGFGDSHTTAPDGSMWLSQGTFGAETPDLDPEVTFDFGDVKALDSMKIWNYNESLAGREDELLGRGVATMDVLFAGEDGEFFLLFEELELDRAPGLDGEDFGEVFDLFGLEARFIKFDIVTNQHGSDFGNIDDGFANFAGLSEVQFFERFADLTCDFDADGACGVGDIDLLMIEVGTAAKAGGAVAGPAPTPFDLTSDGVVDDLDRDEWLALAAEENGLSAPYQLGDTNLDLIVDATDLNEVGISWQVADEHRWSKGNFTGGGVNAPDLNEVGINWQQRHPDAPAGAAVPEPNAVLLTMAGMVGLLMLRRRG